MSFLPEDYSNVPTESKYMKFEEGVNKFRILSSAIVGWEDWDNEKNVYRYRINDKPPVSKKKDGKVKHFWAFIVWNYKESKVQILQITQASIQKSIKGLVDNEDWGDPKGFDISVSRKGSGLETEYTTTPSPHKPLIADAKDQFAAMDINLEALFDGEDPFAPASSEQVDPDSLPEDLK